MKRILLNTLKIILLIIGFGGSLYYFLPWAEAGKFAMSIAHSQLEKRGMRMSYSDVSGEEGGFTVHNLTLSGMVNLSFSSITLKPQMLSSVLSLAPVCSVEFKGGSIQLGQVMSFGDGGVLVTAGREILLENLRTNGDFSVNGYITINTGTMKIGRADARLDVPENFANNMGMLRNFLPLVQDGGRWYLRRN